MSTTPEAKGQSHKASTPSTEDDKSFFADVSAIAPIGECNCVKSFLIIPTKICMETEACFKTVFYAVVFVLCMHQRFKIVLKVA